MDYYGNTECKWRVKIQDDLDFLFGGYVIKVIFNDFNLQAGQASSFPGCLYDNLEFYDGYSQSSPLLGSYCGTVHPEVIYSTGSYLFIKFHIGSPNAFGRFSISVSVVGAEKASGICRPSTGNGNAIDVRGHYGTIFTPDYPVPYQTDTTCVWRLYAADDERVKLTFVDFELGQSIIDTKYSFCDVKYGMDYVEIHDGESSIAKPVGRYCGKKTPFDVHSSRPHMLISFHGNRGVLRVNRGFKAHFESVKLLYNVKQCLPGNKKNLELRLTGSNGALQSPEYYPPDLYCEWLITVPDGKKVELTFERFELDFATFEYGCSDYVQIHDGDSSESNTIESFCGNVIPKPIKSSGRHMYIRFQADSDYDRPRRGFKATFKAVEEFPALGLAVGVVVGVIVLGIMVCCVVHHVKRKNTPNREAGVEIPLSTSTQPGVVQEPHQPAENTFSSPSVGYAPIPTNPPPPEYPYPLEPPPPYPGKEGEPQYPPPGQSYPWQQSGGSAPVLESP